MVKKDVQNGDAIHRNLDEENFIEFRAGCDLGYRMGLTGCNESTIESAISQSNPKKKPVLCWGIRKGFTSALSDIKEYKKFEQQNTVKAIWESRPKENEKGLER